MKKLSGRLLIIFYILLFLNRCSNLTLRSNGVVEIENSSNEHKSIKDSIPHKPFDFVAFKTFFPNLKSKTETTGQFYGVTYYQIEKGSLNTHTAYYGTDEEYNKASYMWLNDTTVSVRLFDEITKKQLEFVVYGNGSTSAIVTSP
jgi:hypothetical protein